MYIGVRGFNLSRFFLLHPSTEELTAQSRERAMRPCRVGGGKDPTVLPRPPRCIPGRPAVRGRLSKRPRRLCWCLASLVLLASAAGIAIGATAALNTPVVTDELVDTPFLPPSNCTLNCSGVRGPLTEYQRRRREKPPSWLPPVFQKKPPKCRKVRPVRNLDLEEYARASWYVQEQQLTGNPSVDELFCKVVTFNKGPESRVWWFEGEVLTGYNYANLLKVNGDLINPKNKTQCLRSTVKLSGEMQIAPCYLPPFMVDGPYLVLGVGANSNEDAANGLYDWAVVIGGQPDLVGEQGCTVDEFGLNNKGLWLLTRSKRMSPNAHDDMHIALARQGVATSRLRKVDQEGCLYRGAYIKEDLRI